MATSHFFRVFLLLSLLIAFHVHARESQFFSKFTANSDVSPVGPSKEQLESLEKQSQDPPSFVAETQNGFGLYGHESGQFPASDTASAASMTSFGDEPYYNKDVFATEDETAGDSKALLQGSYDSTAVNGQNNYFPGESYGNVVVNGRNNYYAVGNRYAANDDNNVQQQQQQQQQEEEGMSDTRFVENGKYYYNANDEERYDPARYTDSRNAEFHNNNQGGYYGDSYAEASAVAGGYEPVKDMNEFRGTKNVDEEFMP